MSTLNEASLDLLRISCEFLDNVQDAFDADETLAEDFQSALTQKQTEALVEFAIVQGSYELSTGNVMADLFQHDVEYSAEDEALRDELVPQILNAGEIYSDVLARILPRDELTALMPKKKLSDNVVLSSLGAEVTKALHKLQMA